MSKISKKVHLPTPALCHAFDGFDLIRTWRLTTHWWCPRRPRLLDRDGHSHRALLAVHCATCKHATEQGTSKRVQEWDPRGSSSISFNYTMKAWISGVHFFGQTQTEAGWWFQCPLIILNPHDLPNRVGHRKSAFESTNQ